MPRHIVSGVTLTGWIGFQAQPFSIPTLVSQFQGSNGAGKTTAMVATVMPFVPIPSRLSEVVRRFPDPSGAEQQGGLHNLMLDGGPTHSVVTLKVGSRVVHLCVEMVGSTNTQKVALKPFMVEGLAEDVSPLRFLIRMDGKSFRMLDAKGIDRAVALLGGTIWRAGTTREWYAALYERRIIAKPLQEVAEQALFASLLLNAFGQKPEQILASLGDFLLPERGASAEVLTEVQRQHEDFRRTAGDLQEARARHRMVSGLWNAGRNLWGAGFDAAARACDVAGDAAARAATELTDAARAEKRTATAAGAAAEALALAEADQEGVTAEVESSALRLGERARALQAEVDSWKDPAIRAANAREALRTELGLPLPRQESFVELLAGLQERQSAAESALAQGKAREDAAGAHLFEVQASAGRKGQVGMARTLAAETRWDRLKHEEACRIAAVLGGKVNAQVSADPRAAAIKALKSGSPGAEGWYHDGGKFDPAEIVHSSGGRVVIDEGDGFFRVAKLPDSSPLGAANRARMLEEAQREHVEAKAAMAPLRAAISDISKQIQACELALSVPAEELDRVPAERGRNRVKARIAALDRLQGIGATAARGGLRGGERDALEPDEIELAEEHLASVVAVETARDALAAAGRKVAEAEGAAAAALRTVTAAREADAAATAALAAREAAFEAWENALQGESLLATALAVRPENPGNPLVALNELDHVLRGPDGKPILAGFGLVGMPGERLRELMGAVAEGKDAPDAAPVLALVSATRMACMHLAAGDNGDAADPMVMIERLAWQVNRMLPVFEQSLTALRDGVRKMHTRMVSDVREARNRIEALNGDDEVSFGQFTSIRLRLGERREMLDRLKELLEAAAERMDSSDLDIENLLIQANKDGKFQTQKNRSLIDVAMDYRTYCFVQAEVQRAGQDFVPIHLTSASTGEAIGVAFLCLLRVLESWERSDPRRHPDQPLRMLFIDEATRLDANALRTVTELAAMTESSILVAAPADAIKGEACTTFHLVRVQQARGPHVAVRVVGKVVDPSGAFDQVA